VLIVDDNEDAALLLSEILQAAGYRVQTAADGFEALDQLKSFIPDIAVIDIGLPIMSGYELAVRLREAAKQPVRLIALSGYGQESDLARSHTSGFECHLVKPVDARQLLDSIREIAERSN